MKIAPNEWSFWFPDDGETEDDAIPIIGKIWDADDAAHEACKYDFSSRDGWERNGSEFDVVIRSPKGELTTYVLWHEPSVEHEYRLKE